MRDSSLEKKWLKKIVKFVVKCFLDPPGKSRRASQRKKARKHFCAFKL